jgi:hypothetical protein
VPHGGILRTQLVEDLPHLRVRNQQYHHINARTSVNARWLSCTPPRSRARPLVMAQSMLC